MKLLVILLVLIQNIVSSSESTVIVTAFHPFMGRGKNGSETILNSLRSETEFGHIKFEILDVGWKQVKDYHDSLKSQSIKCIIGIGEGFNGVVTIETMGKNIMNGKDEFEQSYNKSKIIHSAPDSIASRIGFNFINGTTYDLPVIINNNAGDYLCNYSLFLSNSSGIPISGFIHVPPQGHIDDTAYVKSVKPIVLEILRQNCK